MLNDSLTDRFNMKIWGMRSEGLLEGNDLENDRVRWESMGQTQTRN